MGHRTPGTAQDKPKGRRYAGRVRLAIVPDRATKSLCGFVRTPQRRGSLPRAVAGPFAQVLDVRERLDAKGRVRVPLNIMFGAGADDSGSGQLTGPDFSFRQRAYSGRGDEAWLWGSVSPEVR